MLVFIILGSCLWVGEWRDVLFFFLGLVFWMSFFIVDDLGFEDLFFVWNVSCKCWIFWVINVLEILVVLLCIRIVFFYCIGGRFIVYSVVLKVSSLFLCIWYMWRFFGLLDICGFGVWYGCWWWWLKFWKFWFID